MVMLRDKPTGEKVPGSKLEDQNTSRKMLQLQPEEKGILAQEAYIWFARL